MTKFLTFMFIFLILWGTYINYDNYRKYQQNVIYIDYAGKVKQYVEKLRGSIPDIQDESYQKLKMECVTYMFKFCSLYDTLSVMDDKRTILSSNENYINMLMRSDLGNTNDLLLLKKEIHYLIEEMNELKEGQGISLSEISELSDRYEKANNKMTSVFKKRDEMTYNLKLNKTISEIDNELKEKLNRYTNMRGLSRYGGNSGINQGYMLIKLLGGKKVEYYLNWGTNN